MYTYICGLDCDVNCHRKCEKLMPNLCGVNQKLVVEALATLKRGNPDLNNLNTKQIVYKTADVMLKNLIISCRSPEGTQKLDSGCFVNV